MTQYNHLNAYTFATFENCKQWCNSVPDGTKYKLNRFCTGECRPTNATCEYIKWYPHGSGYCVLYSSWKMTGAIPKRAWKGDLYEKSCLKEVQGVFLFYVVSFSEKYSRRFIIRAPEN